MFSQVMQGLREVHANKLLHLDLKPANIYLRLDGTPILLDFGAARQTAARRPAQAVRRCTRPASRRPSCIRPAAATLGPWSDIYSIGASMFACMVGAPPQPADQRLKNDRMEWHHFEKLHGQSIRRADRGHTLVPDDRSAAASAKRVRAAEGAAPGSGGSAAGAGPAWPA
jgi:serine/threonine protein kinase